MSESFSDLWASSNPVKSQQTPLRTLGSAVGSTSNAARRNTPDAFSMLASAGSSQPNSRPITPSYLKQQPISAKNDTIDTADAFRGLVSFGGSVSRDSNLTIAERASKAEQERKERTLKSTTSSNPQGSFWDQYEGPSVDKAATSAAPAKSDDGWDLDFLNLGSAPSASEPTKQSKTADLKHRDSWDLDFKEPVRSVSPATANSAPDVFDIDHLATLGKAQPREPSRTNTPGSFDFGDREDQIFETTGQDDDDILGTLAKPVAAVRAVSPKPPKAPPAPPELSSRTSSSSPPPHILGKIVEMGFSIQQAKVALAATSTGLDVDAALEILLQNTSSKPEEKMERVQPDVTRKHNQHQGLSRPKVFTPGSSSSQQQESIQQQGLQEQADKLLAQASTIGLTMFNKANAFWREGREKVAKVYEEQRSGSMGTDVGKGKGRPKWMESEIPSEDGDGLPVDNGQQSGGGAAPPARFMPDAAPSKPSLMSLVDEQPVYRSPARRRFPTSTPASKAPSNAPSQAPSKASSPSPVATTPPPPPIVRPTVELSASALAASSMHKATGTEYFKLGRFSEAEAAYSRAIDALPVAHLLRIPLQNNRALTRLKTGDYKGTIDDTSEVLQAVVGDLGTAWHPGREMVGSGGEDLGDAVGKALRRRAEAYEGLEKWKEATRDWERLAATVWIGHALKRDAYQGAGRCRRMAAGRPLALPSKPRPKPAPPTRVSPPARPSEALSRVRAANSAHEQEEQARHDLKDVVDARLAAWRTGKETNLRALIASLDTVLSPTFAWQKVGMAELVSPGQVKVRYTKAIAKLHPDKLNVNKTTLEERMIANSVFGTLNEAWNAFR